MSDISPGLVMSLKSLHFASHPTGGSTTATSLRMSFGTIFSPDFGSPPPPQRFAPDIGRRCITTGLT